MFSPRPSHQSPNSAIVGSSKNWRNSSPRLRLRTRNRSPILERFGDVATGPAFTLRTAAGHFFRISAANVGPKRFHQNCTAAWQRSGPRPKGTSSPGLIDGGWRAYIISGTRVTSGEPSKWRKGWRTAGGYGTPSAGSSRFAPAKPVGHRHNHQSAGRAGLGTGRPHGPLHGEPLHALSRLRLAGHGPSRAGATRLWIATSRPGSASGPHAVSAPHRTPTGDCVQTAKGSRHDRAVLHELLSRQAGSGSDPRRRLRPRRGGRGD